MPELANSLKPEAVVVIRNIKGLHARTHHGNSIGGTSIMGLMMLAAGPGSELHIVSEGPQGPEALQALVRLVEAGFDEECVGDA